MEKEIRLKTRDWERLLTPVQVEKYKNAIRKGYFTDYHGIEWRHSTFYGAFLWKHPNRVKVIDRFTDILGHKPEWEDITDDNLRDLVETLSENYSKNSVRTFTAEIKAVLRENGDSHDVPSAGFGKILKSKSAPVNAVYLTDSEIRRIVSYVPERRSERYTHRLFVLECLTGARFSDCKRITNENIIIDDTKDSGKFLSYVSEKSHVHVKVPIHKLVRPFLPLRAEDMPKTGANVSLSFVNSTIRDICKKCGIDERVKIFEAGREQSGPKWKFVSTHTGRRSFATNLSKRGVSIEQIALLMGHMIGNVPNIEMTQRYICGKMNINSDVLRLFGVYDEDYI